MKLHELAESDDCGLDHGIQGRGECGIREIGNDKRADPASVPRQRGNKRFSNTAKQGSNIMVVYWFVS